MTTPTIGPAPPGFQRLKLLQRVEYAHQILLPDSIVILDDTFADQLIAARRAAPAPAPTVKMISTNCPRCQAPMSYPEVPEPGARWTACAGCGHGWVR
jgi:hypothetical protein